MTTATAAAPEAAAKVSGERPVLRAVVKNADDSFSDVMALWPAKKAGMFTGYVKTGDAEQRVVAFSNEVKETGAHFLNVYKAVGKGEEHGAKLGTGNAINSHKDGSPVYFDTVAFNIGEQSIFAKTTSAANETNRTNFGFISAQVPRPAYVESDAGGERAAAPRG